MRLDAELAQQSRRHHGIDGARVDEETQLGAAVWPGRIGDAQANMSRAHDLKTSLLVKVYHVARHCKVVTFGLQIGSQVRVSRSKRWVKGTASGGLSCPGSFASRRAAEHAHQI